MYPMAFTAIRAVPSLDEEENPKHLVEMLLGCGRDLETGGTTFASVGGGEPLLRRCVLGIPHVHRRRIAGDYFPLISGPGWRTSDSGTGFFERTLHGLSVDLDARNLALGGT